MFLCRARRLHPSRTLEELHRLELSTRRSWPMSLQRTSRTDSRWLANASPLILLGRVDQVELLGALAKRVAVPRAVVWEVCANARPDRERTVDALTAIESSMLIDDAVS